MIWVILKYPVEMCRYGMEYTAVKLTIVLKKYILIILFI